MAPGLGYKASPFIVYYSQPRFDWTLIIGWLIIGMNVAAIVLAVLA